MLYNPFRGLRRREWGIWLISLAAVLCSALVTAAPDPVTLIATMIGVTALIFVARGDVWGQVLTVVFAILYSISSWKFQYYGEIITYLGMSAPIAAASVVTWIKNPYRGEKNDSHEVKIHHLSCRGTVALLALTAAVTIAFYFILKALGNTNLLVSTFSVATSFAASSLMLFRSSYYAVAYAANDVVLIILWLLAAKEDISHLPMAINFFAFLVNDIYGFVSWKAREKRQK